ncbi:MAG TPA: asparagine synthase (glutamine-hydrolyzing) [Bacteroidia bacterium]|nr:asparagine synthase (glutamine-hydrolyzing) [Bacteroidia bacterium]
MCGIAGIYRINKSIELRYQPEVLKLLSHRGPDAQNFKAYNDAIFYHTRLSIIDLSEQSNQPFVLDNHKCIVFNGEIFNYKELAKNLDNISTQGDTEILIKYFDKYKTKGLSNINGFFSFAYYDEIADELYIVRDRFGEKPLYYYQDENILAFSSEIHPLLILIQKKLPIDYDVLYTYFRLHYITGENSILKGIKRLLPGHYLHISNNKVSIYKWYEIPEQTSTTNFEELLFSAVEKRLISDAPVGAFLSGGIDSSITCAIAKKLKNDLHTFSLGYKNEKLYNETSDAEIVAKHIQSHHHNFEITTDEIIEYLPEFLNKIDEPFADSSSINVFFLSKKIKPYATVAISGDGADELLMGYNKHKVFFTYYLPLIKPALLLLNPLISIFPENRSHSIFNKTRQLKKFSSSIFLSPLAKYISLSQWATDAYIHQLFHKKLNAHYFYQLFEKYKPLNELKLFNLADIEIVLANDMLYKIDFFGMQNAVEIRSPFLDYRVVEYLYNQPLSSKINGTQQKYLLKKTFAHLLPNTVFTKKKSGFEIPLHKILPSFINSFPHLKEDYISNQGLFNLQSIKQLINQLPENTNDAALKLWTIIVFQAWYEKFEKYIETNL